MLAELKEPVNLYFYFSRDAAAKQSPLLHAVCRRGCANSSRRCAARSGGKIHLRVIDPQPFSDDEDRAAEFGLQSLQAGGGDALYFGLAGTNSTDGRSAIPSFQADREEFLEYDVAKLIHELGTPKKPVIGLHEFARAAGTVQSDDGQMGEPWPILTQLQQLFTVRTLTADVDHIDKDVDVLMLVHPKQLPPKTLYAIDQFVMRGGRMLLFVDPNAGADTSGQDPSESARRGDGQPFLGSRAAAARPGASTTIPTKVIGDLELRTRGAHQHAGAAHTPHRHPRVALTPTWIRKTSSPRRSM